MKLTGKQRSNLRSMGQVLEPVISIGKNGLSEELLKAAEEAINIHELIKVRFTDFKDERRELSEELAAKLKAEVAGVIGHTALLYRQSKDPEKRKIRP